MNAAHPDFEARVLRPLDRLAWRLRLCQAVEGLAAVLALAFLGGWVQLLLDWRLRLRLDMRAALLVLILAICGVAAWRRIVMPWRVRFGRTEMACVFERRHPEFNALLVSAVQFHAGGFGDSLSNSPALMAAVLREATTRVRGYRFDALVNAAPARRAALALTMLGAVVVALLTVAPEVMGIWFERNVLLNDVPWPRRTRLIIETGADGLIHGVRGEDVEIRAHVPVGYEVPRQTELLYVTNSGRSGRESLTGVGNRGLRHVFARCAEELRFRLIGGDEETDWREVRLHDRPRVEALTFTISPPAYMQKSTQTLPAGVRVVELYPGSRLDVRLVCAAGTVRATLRSESGPPIAAEQRAETFEITLEPSAEQAYRVELEDGNGLADTRPARFSVRLLRDHPPKVSLQLRGVGNMLTPQARVPIEADFTDDLGLAEAQLWYQVSQEGAVPQSIPLEGFTPREVEYRLRMEWSVESVAPQVGQQVTLLARGRDFDDVSGPKVGESTGVTFRIVTVDELRSELARREQEYRRQLERLTDSQERIRGDLLSILARLVEQDDDPDMPGRILALERRQQQANSQVGIVRDQFTQVLTELELNRAADEPTRQRLSGGVIAPLTELAEIELPAAAELLRNLASEPAEGTARDVDARLAEILARLRAVLDNLIRWEGYQETANMLREIIRLQRELNTETREEIERQSSDVFDE